MYKLICILSVNGTPERWFTKLRNPLKFLNTTVRNKQLSNNKLRGVSKSRWPGANERIRGLSAFYDVITITMSRQ